MLRRSSRLLVADLGASHVACGAFTRRRSGELVLDHLFVDTFSSDVSLDSLWREAVARSLAKISQDARFRGLLAVALPGHLALTKFIKTPAIDRSKRSKVIQFEAAQNIPYPLEDVVWDHLLVSDDGVELEVVITAVKSEMMFGLCAAVNSVGRSVMHASASCIALYDAFRYNYPEVQENTLVMDVGARSTHLLFIERGRFFSRTLPFGGNAVTQGIAEKLGLEFASAEGRKIEILSSDVENLSQSATGRALECAIETFCTKLASEINRSAANVSRQTSAAHPSSGYITGGGAQAEIIRSTLAGKLRMPFHRFASLRQVEVANSARDVAASSEAMLAALIGVAARSLQSKNRAPELLPRVIREELVFRRRQPILITAAVLLVLALIPPLHHFQTLAKAGHAEATNKEAQLQPLRQVHARHRELLQQIEQARKAIVETRYAADKKTSWLRFLTELQDRLVSVEDVWLESLSLVRLTAVAPIQMQADAPTADLRLILTGRLLDERNPISKVSPEAYQRVKALISSFNGSQFIAAIEQERFDSSQSGILRFDLTLVVRPDSPL